MTCRVTITDGTNTFVMDNTTVQGMAVNFSPIETGQTILRFLDGSAGKQTRWRKLKIDVTGNGRTPSPLLDFDYGVPLTITAETDPVTRSIVGWSYGAIENWEYSTGSANWSLTVEEM